MRDGVALELGKSVDRLLLELAREMRMAVPFGVLLRVLEAEIGREVDDLEPAREGRDHLLRRAVRQAAEDQLHLVPVRVLDLDQLGQAEGAQMRKHLAERLARVALGGEQGELGRGMAGEQADELGTRVAARTQDGDLDPVRWLGHDTLPFVLASESMSAERTRKGASPLRTPLWQESRSARD